MDNELRLENEFLLGTMTWSFSRLNSFYNCKYEWFLHYMECQKGCESAAGQFGSFCHHILERYAKGTLNLFELADYYEEHFDEFITEEFPYNKYKDLRESYFEKGLDYFQNIDLILDQYEILGVEKKIEFKIEEYDFIGFIDLLLREKETGRIIIMDHKSATIKILKSGKISKTDLDHFEEFKKQLYLYSQPVIAEYGHVDLLEWNMFKDRNHIQIEWKREEYEATLKWAVDTIELMKKEEDWFPNPEFYYCHYLCSQRRNACEFKC